jgi:hypothetical protein
LVCPNDPQKVPRAFVEGLTDAVCYTVKWLKSSLETVRKGCEQRSEREFGW